MFKKIRKTNFKFQITRRLGIGLLVFVIFTGFGIVIWSNLSNKVQAAWWDDNWGYRQIVAITNAGSAQSNYQVMFTLDTAALTSDKLQSDCDDIRVTDIDGAEIPYWIETGCDSSTTRIWAKVPSISTAGTSIYVYYGNPNASSNSSVQNTFINESMWMISGACPTGQADCNHTDDHTDADTVRASIGTGSYTVHGAGYITTTDQADNPNGADDNYFMRMRFLYLPTVTGNHRFLVNSDDGSEVGIWQGDDYGDGYSTDHTFGAHTVPSYWYGSHAENGTTCATSGTAGTASLTSGTAVWIDTLMSEVTGGERFVLCMDPNGGTTYTTVSTANYPGQLYARTYADVEPQTATPANEEIVTAPLAYWKFDEGIGTAAQDSTSGYSGTLGSVSALSEIGDGADGAVTISSDTNINTANSIGGRSCADGGDAVNYSVTENRSAGTNQIILSTTPSSGCLTSGDEVLIINLLGTSGAYSDVGEYEFATISSIATATLTLEDNLVNGYNGTTQKIMVQRVPNYTNLTVNSSINFFPSDFNGTKGGVMAFRASGTVTVTGTIHANAKGFVGGIGGQAAQWGDGGRGGETYNGTGGMGGIYTGASDDGVAGQGGGGGSGLEGTSGGSGTTGGAGGGGGGAHLGCCGNGGAGGAGGGYGAVGSGGPGVVTGANGSGTTGGTGGSPNTSGGGGGGTYGSASLTTMFMGSGGGGGGGSSNNTAGSGGDGGGIVYIGASTLTVTGGISTNGATGGTAVTGGGSGGGGAGGSVYLVAQDSTLGSSLVTSAAGSGGAASDFHAGGSGGVGRIHVDYVNTPSGTTSPTADTALVTGGGPTPTWETDGKCVSGKCLNFDGVSSIVTAGSVNNVKTISFWAKSASASASFIRLATGVDVKAVSGTIQTDGITSPTIYVNGQPGTTLVANQWTFITVTTGTAITANSIKIGQMQTGVFNGYLDEVKVYNYARSADQVKLDYNSKNAAVLKGAGTILGDNDLFAISNGLNGYWKMDETSGNASDSSGNSLTLTNNGTTTYVSGKFGSGSEHVPGSSQYLSTATTISDVKSVSFWTNPDSTTNYFVSLTSGAYITAASGVLSATGFTGPKIYVNGVQSTTIVADTWQFITVTTETAINANQFYVGRQGSNYYDGTLDEVRTYNRVLAPAEVTKLYNFAPGPVGYWNFEEGGGTSAKDVSTYGNDGTITNGSYTTGKFGKGFNSDGDTDYVTVSADSSINITTSLTMESWVFLTSATAADIIMYKDEGYGMQVASGTLQGAIYAGGSWAWQSCTGLTVGTNAWHHVVIAYSADNTNFLCYYDGVLVSTISRSGAKADSGNSLMLGFNTSSAFTGKLDEIKVYSYQRSAKQIVEDMNGGHPLGGSPVGSQVGFWRFDEGQGTSVYDSSAQKNNGTITGMASPASVGMSGWNPNGKINKSLSFDGSNDTVTVTNNTALTITGALTISAWINMRSTGITERAVISKWSSTGDQRGYILELDSSDKVCLALDSDGATGGIDVGCSSTSLSRNRWYHVTAVYTPSTSIDIYINGKLDGRLTSGIDSGIFASTANFLIGGSVSGWANLFIGDIDEVKVYNSALTQSEINIDYNLGQSTTLGVLGTSTVDGKTASNSAATAYCVPGDTSTCRPPVLEWKFEEGVGASAFDSSGFENTGTLTNGPTYVPGKFGKGLNFLSPSSQYVGDATIATSLAADTSVSGWFKSSSQIDANGRMFVLRGTGCGLQIYLGTTGIVGIDNSGGPSGSIDSSAIFLDGKWHHAAATREGTTYKLYVDGKLIGSTGGSLVTYTGMRAGAILAADCGSDRRFNGALDHALAFDYARTQAQIAYEYNRGAPLAHYRMDECQGTTANDSSGNNYFGAITGTVGTCETSATTMWYDGRNGKYNSSLDFDGTDDYVAIDKSALTNFGDYSASTGFTLSAWIKYTTGAASEAVFMWGSSSSSTPLFGINTFSGKARFEYRTDNNTEINGGAALLSTTSVDDGDWHHVLVYRSGTVFRIYVDGIMEKQLIDAAGFNTLTANQQTIGALRRDSGAESDFDGQIDEVKVWNYPLTDSQIKTEFNQGAAVRFGPLTGAP